jgi:peptide-methionine (S)-S-oxide reductase
MPELPARPSIEHLRKQAKRLARERDVPLAQAQRDLARKYDCPSWAALLAKVERARGEASLTTQLFDAIRACDTDAVAAAIKAGANPRRALSARGEPALHLAARLSSLAVVEALIEAGALEWQTDGKGRTALDAARRGRSPDRSAIVALLDRRAIGDPAFRAAVHAIHIGDEAGLARLLDEEPRLLVERIQGPEVYRRRARADYFRDPKLFWFVANNPTTVDQMAPNIVDVARVMIQRGVAQGDLDYTLALVMTSSSAREQGHQLPLLRLLLEAGAMVSRDAILSAAAHRERESLRALIADGRPLDALLAAALGEVSSLPSLLQRASQKDRDAALGLAVINQETEAARMAIAAGADVNAFLPIHSHSTALHQAAAYNDVELIRLLLDAGARDDSRDTLWDATPREWALFADKIEAAAALDRDES